MLSGALTRWIGVEIISKLVRRSVRLINLTFYFRLNVILKIYRVRSLNDDARYSESLFALCSFAGLWQFVSGRTWTAALIFGLSSGVRSNGVLHAGFFCFQAMHCAYKAAIQECRFLVLTRLFCCPCSRMYSSW